MQWVRYWPRLGYRGYDKCSGYGMSHAWVTEEMSEEKCTHYDTHFLLCFVHFAQLDIFDCPCHGMRIIYTASKV